MPTLYFQDRRPWYRRHARWLIAAVVLPMLVVLAVGVVHDIRDIQAHNAAHPGTGTQSSTPALQPYINMTTGQGGFAQPIGNGQVGRDFRTGQPVILPRH